MKIAILIDKKPNAAGIQSFLASQEDELKDIRILDRPALLQNPELSQDVQYLFSSWNMPRLNAEEIATALPALKSVFYAAGDISYFCEPFEAQGVAIYSAQIENSVPVAEFTVAQIILANKGYFQAQQTYRTWRGRIGFFRARAKASHNVGNFGSRIGLIGLGTVGRNVAEFLRPFDFEVLVHDPFAAEEQIQHFGAQRASLEDLFATCDVISNHLPDLPETRGLLDYDYFKTMKLGATFINTGRGRQVDEIGLARALREKPTRTALLDVTCREPLVFWSPLYRCSNVFLTPHIAGSRGLEVKRMYQAVFEKYVEVRDL